MNFKEILKEANSKIKNIKLNDRVDFENLNSYISKQKAPLATASEGTAEYYAYFVMQNFSQFIDKCRDKYLKGLSLNKIEAKIKRYWTKNYNKFN